MIAFILTINISINLRLHKVISILFLPHVARDYEIYPDSSTQQEKLIVHLFRFCTFFTKSRYVTPAHNLLLFTLNILLNQLTSNVPARILGWQFYNFKSSIPNKLASLFGKITIRSPLQWFQNFVLDKTLTTILCPISLESKISLPALKAQQKDQMPAAIRLLLFPRLLPFLRLLLQLMFLLSLTSSQNSWKYLWSQPRLETKSKQSFENNY